MSECCSFRRLHVVLRRGKRSTSIHLRFTTASGKAWHGTTSDVQRKHFRNRSWSQNLESTVELQGLVDFLIRQSSDRRSIWSKMKYSLVPAPQIWECDAFLRHKWEWTDYCLGFWDRLSNKILLLNTSDWALGLRTGILDFVLFFDKTVYRKIKQQINRCWK